MNITVVVKMKLNPIPEMQSARQQQKQRSTKKPQNNSQLVPYDLKMDQKPMFFISTPYTFDLEKIRVALEESDAVVGTIEMKMTNSEIAAEVMDKMTNMLKSSVNLNDFESGNDGNTASNDKMNEPSDTAVDSPSCTETESKDIDDNTD